MNARKIPREILIARVIYNPETGIFTWRTNRISSLVGKEILEVTSKGYAQIRINGKRMSAHRAAWVMTYNSHPISIDHINGVRTDNRIINLRACTHAENHQNRCKQINNTSGFMGVSWHKARGAWRATICIKGKSTHLGLFPTKEEAYNAYCEAKKTSHQFCKSPR